jgi:chorismate-pyruvate lyase
MTPSIPAGLRRPTEAGFSIAHPLDEFYGQLGLTLPPLEQVDGEEVPQPYKELLVHHDDMTPTLEKFHGRNIHLRLLGRRQKGDEYYREVVLLLDGTEEPVEFGAIKMHLNLFPAEARHHILDELRPLGHVMQECAVQHCSRPKAFLRLASDQFINRALKLTGVHVLHGRRNTLFDLRNRPLAEIVEILPPVARTHIQSA